MASYEFPLVVFTLFSQTAIGLSMAGFMQGNALCLPKKREQGLSVTKDMWAEEQNSPFSLIPRFYGIWCLATILMAIGLFASLFHLGHPFHAPWALRNIQGAWLSREVLAFSIFFGLLILTTVCAKGKSRALAQGKKVGRCQLCYELSSTLTLASGLVALITSGMAYAPPAQAAMYSVLPLLFFTISTISIGFAMATWFVPAAMCPALHKRLSYGAYSALLVGALFYITIPCVWISGGAVLQMTGVQWFSSPWFWGQVLFGFLWPLLIIWRLGCMPLTLPLMIFAGALMGRMTFFADTLSTAVNIGNPY